MCRSIKTLANFEPPATDEEVQAAALQFVRKLSGAPRPSRSNQAAFDQAVDEVAAAAERLIRSLRTTAPARNRDDELRKARARAHRASARSTESRQPTAGSAAPTDATDPSPRSAPRRPR